MAVRFGLPAKGGRARLTVSDFWGVDFTNQPTNVDVRRSPGAVNMIRDVPGKVRKMMGYERLAAYDGRINGVHFLAGGAALVHAGRRILRGEEVLYEEAADERSCAWQLGAYLYILDGKCLLRYDGESLRPAAETAYVPTVTIANSPAGRDGAVYEELNLLQPQYCESFLGTAGAVQYQLGFAPLDAAAVQAEVLNAQGVWQAKREGVDFTVDRASGVVTFLQAPGAPPVTGEDNVRVTAARTVEGYARRINGCRAGVLFGVGGAPDRLFVAGNPDYANRDWFSAQNDATYFGDLSYSVLGSAASAIMGYTVIGDKLAAHKDEADPCRNIILREGRLAEGKAAFPMVNALQGAGAVSRHGFGYLAAEPLFLTRLGVYAITPQDATAERYAQNRSFYLNGRLLGEAALADAFCCSYKDFFFVCVGGRGYILDGLQPFAPAGGLPYSTRQYAGFYRENLPARVMWERDGRLFFGSEAGVIYRFYQDAAAPGSYNDDGAAIVAWWETPDIGGEAFYAKKSFCRLAVRLAATVATGVAVFGFCRGHWQRLVSNASRARYLDFGAVTFSKFTFSGDYTPKLFSSKIWVKQVDKARFAFENGEVNEPFGLFDIALEYREGGRAH